MKKHFHLYGLVFVISFIVSACASNSQLEPLAPPEKIIWVGNSLSFWNDGIEVHLLHLAESANPPKILSVESEYGAAVTLEYFWKGMSLHEKIANGKYDIVILQEGITVMNKDTFKETFDNNVQLWNEEIRANGSEPVLYMAMESPLLFKLEELTQAYDEIATEYDLHVIPLALAYQRILEENPEYNLYDVDRLHPNIQGTYLGALTAYATLFGENPEGLAYIPDGISEEDAIFLQRVAWEAVQEYQSSKSR